jgi:hypothetical protein
MDRSFLSDKAVIAASRAFVCVRLATYESASEAVVLKSFFVGRSGELENSTFAILAPDGKTKLTRAGRSPSFAYGRNASAPAAMAAEMNRLAKRYPGKRAALKAAPLPLVADVRLGINIAACDSLPLVVVVGKDAAQRAKLEKTLAPVAWDEANLGAFIYASTHEVKDLKPLTKVKASPGYVVVQPGVYGQDGSNLVQLPASATPKALAEALAKARKKHSAAAKKDRRSHVRTGQREGVHWDTEIPVTDPGKGPGRGGRPPR